MMHWRPTPDPDPVTEPVRTPVRKPLNLAVWRVLRRGPAPHPHPSQALAHWEEFLRCERRRRGPSTAQYVTERTACLETVAASRGRPEAARACRASLARFPWTDSFTDADHCLGSLRVCFVEIPVDVAAAAAAHHIDLRAQGVHESLVIHYSASWALQRGRHPTGTYEGRPIDFFEFAPTYLRINARDVRVLLADVPGARVVSAVHPAVSEAEVKLTEFAFGELPGFCHPMFVPGAVELFQAWCLDDRGRLKPAAEIVAAFSGKVLTGYSYGAAAALQQVNAITELMRAHAVPPDTVRAALSRLLCIFIAPNVDFERYAGIAKIVARSPLDAVVTGHPGLGIISAVLNDRSSEGLPAETVRQLIRGEFENLPQPQAPVWIDDHTAQYNYALPGVVRFDPSGHRLHHFVDCKDGHDCKPIIRLMRENARLLGAVQRALHNRRAPIDLRSLLR